MKKAVCSQIRPLIWRLVFRSVKVWGFKVWGLVGCGLGLRVEKGRAPSSICLSHFWTAVEWLYKFMS